MRTLIVSAAVVALLGTLIVAAGTQRRPSGSASPLAQAATLPAIPRFFTENRGQIDSAAAFYAEGREMRLAFGAQGIEITQYGAAPGGPPRRTGRPGVRVTGLREVVDPRTGETRVVGEPRMIDPPRRPRHTVHLDFVGARPDAQPLGRERTPTVVSFFKGPRSEWKTGLATYREVVYRELWPGIDLIYRGETDQVKYTFVLQPGADPDAIRLAWRGATGVRVGGDGVVEVTTPMGSFRDEAPVAFQDIDGRREAITVNFDVDEKPVFNQKGPPPGERGRPARIPRKTPYPAWRKAFAGGTPALPRGTATITLGFDVGTYDPTRPLVIDPAYLVYGGFFGGPAGNRGLGIAVDEAGAAYFCGETDTERGDRDAYAVKVSADGTRYDYIAYLGGRASDTCFDIGVDPSGNAYLTGVAGSSVAQGFPAAVGPDLSHNGGGDNTLVAKLDPTGTNLVYAGYLGGNGFDFGEGIRVARDGSVYLSGIAGSTAATFPAVVGPDTSHNGSYDAYVCKLKPIPSAADPKDNYAYCGYIGGDREDVGVFRDNEGGVGITAGHVAIDAEGNAYHSGMTRSNQATFPDGDGFGDLPSADNTHNGGWDAWAVKVRADGKGLVFAGYLGGKGQDEGYGAGVDATGAFYFTGATMSREDFPAVVGPDLSYNGGISDAFVAKVAPDGSHYEYAGFIGGHCSGDCGPDTDEMGVGLTVDAEGHAYPIGWTYGAGTSFPTVNGPDLTPNGLLVSLPGDDGAAGDAWVARVKPVPDAPDVLDNFDFLGFIGGDKWDAAFWVALDGRGGLYVAGDTGSDAATFPNGGGLEPFTSPRTTRAGEYDAFVVKVVFDPTGPTLTPEPTRTPMPTPVGESWLPWVNRSP